MGMNLMFWNVWLAQQRQIKLQKEANALAATAPHQYDAYERGRLQGWHTGWYSGWQAGYEAAVEAQAARFDTDGCGD